MMERPSLERLNAFVDGELGLAEQIEMERLVAGDDQLRARVEGLRALRQSVRTQADYHRAPDALRARLQALAGAAAAPERPARPGRPARPAGSAREAVLRWFAWRPLAGSLAAASVAVVVLHAALQPSPDERLGDDVVASHVRATLAQRLVDVPSSDHHTVKPWLSSRLDFSPPVRELAGSGSTLVGGRVDYVGGRPVAVLVYKRGAHWVDSYVWPAPSGDAAVALSSERGFRLARWRRDGMAHWVVSDLSPQEFEELVRELSAPEPAR